jgi:C4-type Zn-finger protein
VYEELGEKVFFAGDSAASHMRKAEAASGTPAADSEAKEEPSDIAVYTKFLGNLKALFEEKDDQSQIPFTVVLDDPLANSYIQNPYAPDDDPNMTVEHYMRSWEQNEDLGLNDIDV